MKKQIPPFITGMIVAAYLLFAGSALAVGGLLSPNNGGLLAPGYFSMNSNAIVGALSSYTLGSLIQPWPGIWSTSVTATSQTSTSTFAGAVGIGTTTPRYQLQVINPLTSANKIATTTVAIGDPMATTSRSSFTMMSNTGSTTCVYVVGTSTPTLVAAPGACN